MDAYQSSGSSPQESESNQSSPALDLRFENHLSLFLIRPCSEIGQQWLDVGDDSTLTFGNAIVCESKFVEAIYQGAIDAGLEIACGTL
jgi:hypothetical protein